MKLHINTSNEINVAIRMSSIRKTTNGVSGTFQVNYSAPVIEGEGYELRPNPFGNGISVFVGGKEVKTFSTGRKSIASFEVSLTFNNKEEADGAVTKMKKHTNEFIQMLNNKKVSLEGIKAMVNA